ncbi:membrane protein [Bacteroidia bacterium]|nr:membrane protein [Bacteroidia bacterium]
MRTNLKNNFKIGLLGFILVCITSCNDIMDTQSFDKFTEDVVWSNKANADAFIYATYHNIIWDNENYRGYMNEEQWTNNSVSYDGNNLTRDLITRDDDYGFNRFGQIRRCNLIMEKVAASTGITEDDKKSLIAEAKYLRAMMYFYLAKRFGIVVWVDRVLTENEPTYKLPTTPDVKTTYGYIIQDLEDAVKDMPEESPSGRANKYTAYALLSEVCLQAAAYTGETALYQKVIDAADATINSGQYILDPDYESIFNEKGRYSKEIILGTYRNNGNTYCDNIPDLQQGVPNVYNDFMDRTGNGPHFKVDRTFEAWLKWSATQNLVDNYLVIDKNTGKAVNWNESSQFKASVVRENPTNSLVREAGRVTDGSRINELMYNDRDKRFYASIVYDSCTWFNELVTTCIGGNLCRNVGENNFWGSTISNYYFRKGVYNVNPRVYYGIPTDYHWVIFRLGRVYMNKAEALLRQGKVAEAVETFNRTRIVHGQLPPSEATTLEEAWTDYKRERRVEMAKEGDFYWTLLRWGKYGGPANAGREPGGKIAEFTEPAYLIDITKDRKHYQIEQLTINQNNIRVFDETRRYLFPVPQGQRNRNENLGQNSGW